MNARAKRKRVPLPENWAELALREVQAAKRGDLTGWRIHFPDTLLVERILLSIKSSKSSSIRAIWPKWSERWERTRRSPRAVFHYTDRLLVALFDVGTEASYRLYNARCMTWSELPERQPLPKFLRPRRGKKA